MKNLDDLRKSRKISREAELNVLKDTAFQLGRIIERARTTKGKTQNELAKKIGSSQSVIARIESGGKLPSFSFLQRIADAFETYLVPPRFGFMEETIRVVDWYMTGTNSFEAKGELRSEKTLIGTNNYVPSQN